MKSNNSISRIIFLTKFHFLQFQECGQKPIFELGKLPNNCLDFFKFSARCTYYWPWEQLFTVTLSKKVCFELKTLSIDSKHFSFQFSCFDLVITYKACPGDRGLTFSSTVGQKIWKSPGQKNSWNQINQFHFLQY